MPTSACCSAITSGVAIRSVDLHSNHAVLDEDREGLDGHVRRQVQGLSGAQIKARAVARAFDHAVLFVELALHQLAVVVRAAILDGEDLATAVDHADLEVLVLHQALLARRQLVEGADVYQGTHSLNPIPEVRILSSGYLPADAARTARRRDHVRGPARGAYATLPEGEPPQHEMALGMPYVPALARAGAAAGRCTSTCRRSPTTASSTARPRPAGPRRTPSAWSRARGS